MKRREFVRGVAAAGTLTAFGGTAWLAGCASPAGRRDRRLDDGWRFVLGDAHGAQRPGFDASSWQPATLPHTPRIEALVTGPPGSPAAQWQGICWYRRPIRIEDDDAGGTVLLRFEAAMNVADVWLDGEPVGRHLGGFLPFTLDVSDRLTPGRDHLLAVRLDNTDNAITGPKPLAQLDFNTYGGLYRPVWLVRKDRLSITDPLLADVPAGGGVFVTYPNVTPEAATVRVRVHVRNAHDAPRRFSVRVTLRGPSGDVVASGTSARLTLPAGEARTVARELDVARPALWSPSSPALHALDCEVLSGGDVVDSEHLRVGIRRIEISPHDFRINGEPMFLRGTNRHQEHPYIGYAVSDAAQYRDARRIKDAGFDYVRLSHYAQSPAFMDACDELGLVVMDCIPGWQYFNPDPRFAEVQYRNCRDLVRRDRNHPCVALWEVSLNETAMPPEFIARTNAIAHEEYPGDQCFTAGWVPGYDVLLDARQHGGCRHATGTCLVSEYGDWEYYAMNAGLDQDAWQDLSPAESNSRQLRWQGEAAMLQQARNFQEAHDDNLGTIAIGDGVWVMFDYNRGYAPDIESSGCMDIFRLPKYAYQFFRSQRDAADAVAGEPARPVVFIASEWTPASSPDVRVFSNCDEVALHLDGRLIERRGPDRDRISERLAHPPFTFRTGSFRSGTLEAVGYIGGKEAARHVVRTPGPPAALRLDFDLRGRAPDPHQRDDLFCHASIVDASGAVLPEAWENVAYGLTGGGTLIGMNPFATSAGISSILLRTTPGDTPATVHALAIVERDGRARILAAAAPPDRREREPDRATPPHEVRYTTDGTEPGPGAALYAGPVPATPRLRAALLAGGRVVASLAADARKYRVPRSAPPERRGAFRR